MLVSLFLHIFKHSTEPLQHDRSVISFKLENYLAICIISIFEFHFVPNNLIKLNWTCFLQWSWIFSIPVVIVTSTYCMLKKRQGRNLCYPL